MKKLTILLGLSCALVVVLFTIVETAFAAPVNDGVCSMQVIAPTVLVNQVDLPAITISPHQIILVGQVITQKTITAYQRVPAMATLRGVMTLSVGDFSTLAASSTVEKGSPNGNSEVQNTASMVSCPSTLKS